MSWLGKLFGQRSAAEWMTRADAEWAEGDYGRAKLSYESARDGKDATAEQRAHADARVIECRDRLASARLDEAQTLAAGNDEHGLDLARAEIKNALEIAASDTVLSRAREMAARLERGQARQHVEDISAEEPDLIAAIAGSWEPDQAEEYEACGEPLQRALIDLHEGRAKEALETLQALMKDARDPHYLHFELARALLMTGDHAAGGERLRTFLKRIGPDEGGEARLVAHMELAGLAKEGGDFDAAVNELEQAIEALPEDPRPYLTLGMFLRKEGHASEAIEVLDAAQVVMGEARPEWRILQELGLAHAAAGNEERGVELLERVVQMFSAQRLTDLPHDTAVPLAELHEKLGNKVRAADLYASLAKGTDRERLHAYNLNAARLLIELGQRDDAMRLLQQATELANTPEERQAAEALASSV